MEDNDLGNPQLAEEPLVWRHPQEPILTVEGSTHLVFLQGKYPSKVAYREGQGTILFWDLGYLWDVFREGLQEGKPGYQVQVQSFRRQTCFSKESV